MQLPSGSPSGRAALELDDALKNEPLELDRAAQKAAQPISSRLMYIIMYIQGLSLLFAWSSLMNSGNFFIDRLAGMENNYFVLDYLLVVFFGVRIVFVLASRYIMSLVRPFRLVMISELATTAIFLVFGSLALWHSLPNGLFLALVVVLVFLSSAFAVASFVSVYSILSSLDPKFTQAVALGHGSAGLVTAILKMISIVVSRTAQDASEQATGTVVHVDSVIYFYLTSVIALAALLLFLPMKRMEPKKKNSLELAASSSSNAALVSSPALPSSSGLEKQEPVQAPAPPPLALERARTFLREHYRVYKEIRVFFWCIFVVVYQMVLVVPAFIYLTQSVRATREFNLYHPNVYAIFNLILYSIGDFLGRLVLRWPQFTLKTPKYLILVSALRFLFVPLYLLGNIVLKNATYSVAPVLGSDVFFSISLCIFGFSGGLMTTNLLMYGPKAVRDAKDRNTASFCIVFCQGAGLLLAATSALLLKIVLYATATPASTT